MSKEGGATASTEPNSKTIMDQEHRDGDETGHEETRCGTKMLTSDLALGGRYARCSNITYLFQDITKVATSSKARIGIKRRVCPTCGNVLIRHQTKGTKCGGMIRTLTSKIWRMTGNVLHSMVSRNLNCGRLPVIGLCPSRYWLRVWKHKKCKSVNHGQPGHGAQGKRALRPHSRAQQCCWSGFCFLPTRCVLRL